VIAARWDIWPFLLPGVVYSLRIQVSESCFFGLLCSCYERNDMSKLYDLEMESITGEMVSFSDYKDHVLLIVNVASK
jgi:hypothetical protein